MAEYIRHNDEAMLKASERVLSSYRDELLPCTSFEEFCDIVGKFVKKKLKRLVKRLDNPIKILKVNLFILGLLEDIRNPSTYIDDLLRRLA